MNKYDEDNLSAVYNFDNKYSAALLSLIIAVLHTVYMIFFFKSKIVFMGALNILSVLFYLFGAFYMFKYKNIQKFGTLALGEILIHAILASLFTGWDYGFHMILISTIPVPYLFSVEYKKYMHWISSAIIMLFISLRICCVDLSFSLNPKPIQAPNSLMYLLNSLSSLIAILMVIFGFRKKMTSMNESLIKQNERLMKTASIDSLTGLFNRRAMSGFMDDIHERFAANGTGYCIILMDIDLFKKVNDTYGHAAGDSVLVQLSEILMKSIPAEGYICRWGGEEILAIVPNTKLDECVNIAENIRRKIENTKFISNESEFTVTATFGVCDSHSGLTVEQAIIIADHRLYYGKEHGRNQVVSEDLC